jgi:hypothetical protein
MSIEETTKKLGPLYGGLWHTTHPERFLRIMESGSILPEPDIPDHERWATGRGADFYPFVRHIGGVSLFDFQDFDYEEYDKSCPLSNWREFVPVRSQWRASIWIEIDRKIGADALIPAAELKIRFDRENAWKHRWMPRIESAYTR